MEENKIITEQAAASIQQQEEEKTVFTFYRIYTAFILHWEWFLVSVLLCLAMAFVYMRYKVPTYQISARFLIKDDNSGGSSSRYRSGRRSVMNSMSDFGFISATEGFDNEIEILKSQSLATQAVRDAKLYVNYIIEGRVKDRTIFMSQPVTVDIDAAHLDKLPPIVNPISMTISKEKTGYQVTGQYFYLDKEEHVIGPIQIDRTFASLPATISTRAGILTFTKNNGFDFKNKDLFVTINSPEVAAKSYLGRFKVAPSSKTTTIADLTLNDQAPARAIEYLKQLAICYNRQANEDKNLVALRTEAFINDRLEKINAELGSTEGALESYKKRNNMVELKINAQSAVSNTTDFDKKLVEANTQLALINSLNDYVKNPANHYKIIPNNVGLTDASSTQLITAYNQITLERNRLLQSASENSPMVQPLTAQLDELSHSIKQAFAQAKRNYQIQRDAVAAQYSKYAGFINNTPEQERVLNQIGRQQEVKSDLYLMLLQKREENSISLAATADKGKLIDEPAITAMISFDKNIVLLIALLFGFGIPSLALYVLSFFRYRIEGHEDVAMLTRLPILADVAVASDTAKTKADIVVHENKNNQMEEIFRSMRTNLQFMLKEGEKTVMFTSTTSGEGKTFNAANLAVSFALLNKKVIIVGLDIRKPRLAELFEINDHHHGITPLMMKENPTWEEIQEQILPSLVHKNLDLLMSGPIPPNPAELMERPSLDIIFERLREHYDFIVIDTAPVGLVTDTLHIGRVANATVYMCRADYTAKSSFDLINALDNDNKLPNMSIVINGVDMSKRKYGYYYGYGRYGKYGRYGRYGTYGRYGSYGKYGYGRYGNYGNYGSYGAYGNSHYGNKNDHSVKLK